MSTKEILLLDGALGTQLENLIDKNSEIQPKNDPLWSTKVLIKRPDLIAKVHSRYLESGSRILTTATYQASFSSLQHYANFSNIEEATKLWKRAVKVAKNCIQEYLSRSTKSAEKTHWICGSVGPYGAYLADGSEYTGDYGDFSNSKLDSYHYPLVNYMVLDDNVDIVGLETIPNFREFKVLLNLMLKLNRHYKKEKKFYLSFSCRDGKSLCDGTLIDKVMNYLNTKLSRDIVLRKNLIAIGCNCVNQEIVLTVIDSIQSHNEHGHPLIVYPNLGFIYSREHQQYEKHRNLDKWVELSEAWLRKGVKYIGGCCSTGPEEISALRKILLK